MAWQEDAREFGRFVRQGGWRLGLLAARNCIVPPGLPGGTKVPLNAFASAAGISPGTVSLHLRAWEAAADEGYVPHAARLDSQAEPDLDLTELPPWSTFYRSERQLAGRAGSIELHPDPEVMARRLAGRDDAPQIAQNVVKALPPAERVKLAVDLTEQVEQEHVPRPLPPKGPPMITVESVQRVLDDLDRVREDIDRLPPVLSHHSKALLSAAADDALPQVIWLSELLLPAAAETS